MFLGIPEMSKIWSRFLLKHKSLGRRLDCINFSKKYLLV